MDSQNAMHDDHPELWHYTTKSGLEGILSSKQLWATDFRCLNDTSEIRHLRSYLDPYLLPQMVKIYRNEYERNNDLRAAVTGRGGIEKCALHDAKVIINSLYEHTFSQKLGDGPFIISFCSHVNADDWTTQHGLLSQWRAYADGGYAIVFDTKGLIDLLTQENAAYYYWHMQLSDVIYDDDMHRFEHECSNILDIIPNALNDIFRSADLENLPNVDRLFRPFVGATSRFKHRAFREESEVRIVAYPLREEEIPEQERTLTRSFKRTHIRCGNIAYIKLFDGNRDLPFPIKRIVVGPYSRQVDLRAEALRLVADQDFPVECSCTPYMERQFEKPR